MDSVTQAVLGASVLGVLVPPAQRKKGLVLGAMLGTLPDLDVFIDYGDAVQSFTYHRSFSHSLFVLIPFAALLWLLLRRFWTPVRDRPWRWWAGISLALVTHPLLDAHTAYGTQLWWPLTPSPTAWATIFIIDPLYTIPLIAAVAVAAARPRWAGAGKALGYGLLASSLYLSGSWLGKLIVERHARQALASAGLGDAPMFSTPTYFNTILWRVVVLTEDGYLEGYDSLVLAEGPMQFQRYPSDTKALTQASQIWAVARLGWFADGFVKATVVDGARLELSDLRMGQEPKYVFSHVVARRRGDRWVAIDPELVPTSFEARDLHRAWARIFSAEGS